MFFILIIFIFFGLIAFYLGAIVDDKQNLKRLMPVLSEEAQIKTKDGIKNMNHEIIFGICLVLVLTFFEFAAIEGFRQTSMSQFARGEYKCQTSVKVTTNEKGDTTKVDTSYFFVRAK